MKYIVETLEITRNFYVIEADSEEEAKEASKTCMDNWHQQLDTTIVDCSELDQDQLKYLIKNSFGMIFTQKSIRKLAPIPCMS